MIPVESQEEDLKRDARKYLKKKNKAKKKEKDAQPQNK